MPKSSGLILVSACLLGSKVRYNGSDKVVGHPALRDWLREGRLVSFCPEVAAGFAIPRPPAEIQGGDGGEVLNSNPAARVIEETGADVTDLFRLGAKRALRIALERGCIYAILTEGSPSCGSLFVYDGSFTGRTRQGRGVTAALLQRHGIRVYSEHEIDALVAELGHHGSLTSEVAPRN